MNIAKLKGEIENLRLKRQNPTMKSAIDYTSQNRVLSEKIEQLRKNIADAKKGIIRKSLFGEER